MYKCDIFVYAHCRGVAAPLLMAGPGGGDHMILEAWRGGDGGKERGTARIGVV